MKDTHTSVTVTRTAPRVTNNYTRVTDGTATSEIILLSTRRADRIIVRRDYNNSTLVIAAMADDPLRLLLRGCKRPSTSIHTNNPTIVNIPPTTSSPQLPRELDFFNNHNLRDNAPQHPHATSPSTPVQHSLPSLVQNPSLQSALTRMNITTPTPIQRRAIPHLLANDHDVIAIAPTGSGKTLAYAIPIMHYVLTHGHSRVRAAPLALIIAPTRELAAQIGCVVTRLSDLARAAVRLKIVSSKAAAAALRAAEGYVDVVIATPLRLAAAVDGGGLSVGSVAHVVLDEADELLDERFFGQVDGVLAMAGREREEGCRVHLFSATLPPSVDELARRLLKHVKKVVVEGGVYGGSAAVETVGERVEQRFLFVGGRGEQGKVLAVRGLLKEGVKPPVLVFVQTQERAAELFRELVYDGVCVDAIHAGRSQAARMSAVQRFREGKVWMLIATDVLARGLDFLGVNCVVNYDVPASAMSYVHRIGRTGRNGREGMAVTLFTEEDAKLLGAVLRVAKASGADVPEWALRLKGVRKDEVRRLERRPPMRRKVGGPNLARLPKRHRKVNSDGEAGKRRREGDGDGVETQRKRVKGKKKRAMSERKGEEIELFEE